MKAYSLINHNLTEKQKVELKEIFGAESVEYPDEELKKFWGQVATTCEIDRGLIKRVTDWLASAEEGDVLVIQGEFGCTFCLVDYALKKGLVPVHAVTERVEEEFADGETVTKKYIFRHCCFRKYEYY